MKPSARQRQSHIFARADRDHYVEPDWVSGRLFAVAQFDGPILDPCCGWGRIIEAAITAGYTGSFGSDVFDRRHGKPTWQYRTLDILGLHREREYDWWRRAPTIVTNPPFDEMENIAGRCLALASSAVAMICPVRRLPAAWRWIERTPLARVWLLTPRPSMPPGSHIAAGGPVGGGTVDYCWLVWRKDHVGPAEIKWLHRDSDP